MSNVTPLSKPLAKLTAKLMIDLRSDECRYPFGAGHAVRFCGKKCDPLSPVRFHSFCPEHQAVCYTNHRPISGLLTQRHADFYGKVLVRL